MGRAVECHASLFEFREDAGIAKVFILLERRLG